MDLPLPSTQVGPVVTLAMRFKNAAMAKRDTASFGQNRAVAPPPALNAQPSVISRFFSHSTFAQNGLVSSTSLKPAHGAPAADPAEVSRGMATSSSC